MQTQLNQVSPQTFNCNVCKHAGFKQQSCTHNTRGPSDPYSEVMVCGGNWPLLRPLGGSTHCPILANTVCTNPMCFNGQNGVVRFPQYGHSRNYCPCVWPEGWETNGPLEHLRYSGIRWNNQGPHPMFFQLPIPNEEVYLDDIEQMVWEEIEDEYAKELDFQHKMDDFIEIQDMEETNAIVVEELTQKDKTWDKRKKILKIQKKIKQVEKTKQQMEINGMVEDNRIHLLENGLMEKLQKQQDDIK